MSTSQANESNWPKNISERLKQALTILREIEEEINSQHNLEESWEKVDDYLDICQVNLINALSIIDLQQQPVMSSPTPIEEAVASLKKHILETMEAQELEQPTEEKLLQITAAQIHWLIDYLSKHPDLFQENIASWEEE